MSRGMTSIQPRMLTQAQAAAYCGIGVKTFKTACPVMQTQLRNGLMRYDRHKLDTWLDNIGNSLNNGEKTGGVDWVDRVYSAA